MTRPAKTAVQCIEDRSIPEPNSGCWLWLGALQGQYEYGLAFFAGRKTGAHRLSYETFRGPIPAGMYVCHRCDNPCCVNPDHLFLGTGSDNMNDCARKGRHGTATMPEKTRRGEQMHGAKLTEADVLEIRALLGSKSQAEIARMFGVSPTVIGCILRGKNWTHVQAPITSRTERLLPYELLRGIFQRGSSAL